MAGWITNGMDVVQPGTSGVTALTGLERLPLDTQLASGENPQSVAATSFQVASAAAAMIYNSGTLSSNTATVNTRAGIVLTGSLNTAVGSTYACTLVNSLATTGTPFQLNLLSDSNTTAGAMIQSATIATTGTISVTIVNNGNAALNGTLLMPFQVGASV